MRKMPAEAAAYGTSGGWSVGEHRVHEVLPRRFERYGLTRHPEKTRLVAFAPPQPRGKEDKEPPDQNGPGSRGSFDPFDSA